MQGQIQPLYIENTNPYTHLEFWNHAGSTSYQRGALNESLSHWSWGIRVHIMNPSNLYEVKYRFEVNCIFVFLLRGIVT